MYQVVQELVENSGDKRKWNGNHYTHNPNNTNNTSNLQPNKRPETTRVFTVGQGSYAGKLPHCGKYGRHHTDACPPACYNCGKARHKAKKEDQEAKEDREVMSLVLDVAKKDITRTSVQIMEVKAVETKFEATNKILRTMKGKIKETLNLCTEVAMKDNNVVNGTFLINNVYASVLFDTGADRSFVSYAFSKYIDIHPTTLDTNYKLGSFDVIVGMDWMAEHRAEVVCYEKYIRVPYGNDMLIVQGKRSGVKNESRLEVISSIRTHKGRSVLLRSMIIMKSHALGYHYTLIFWGCDICTCSSTVVTLGWISPMAVLLATSISLTASIQEQLRGCPHRHLPGGWSKVLETVTEALGGVTGAISHSSSSSQPSSSSSSISSSSNSGSTIGSSISPPSGTSHSIHLYNLSS
ncbi:putative reverse transcriptase domain-containing protein [Tanacetum coccineum]